MLEYIRDLKDHVLHLSSLVRTSKTAPLADKIQAKDVEEQAIQKLDNLLTVSPYGAEKLIKEYLTVGDASKVVSIGMSNINSILANFSSLIHSDDKVITDITIAMGSKRVVNSFSGVKGVMKLIVSTQTKSFGVVLSDDTHYHFADMKFWVDGE